MRKLNLDEFTKYKFLSNVDLSSNGKFACFVMHESNVEDNKYSSNLWLYNEGSGEYRKLTSFDKESNFIWLEDGENILFSSVRDDKDKKRLKDGGAFTQFYKINIHGGEAEKLFRVPLRVGSIKEVREDKFIFTAEYNPMEFNLDGLSDEEKSKELKKRKEEKDYQVIDEIPFWSNGSGFTNKKRDRLYIYDIGSNKCKAITEEISTVGSFNLNEDKSKVVFVANDFKDMLSMIDNVYTYDIESENIDKLTKDEKFSYSYVNFMKDDTIILMGSDMERYGINENAKFYKINTETKKCICITPDFETSTWNSVGSDARYGGGAGFKKYKDHLYFITTERYSSHLNRIDLEGNIEKIIETNGSVDSYAVNGEEILFIGLRDLKLQELYSLRDKKEVQLTDFNGWVNKEISLSKIEKLEVETEDGVIIDGWVLKPADFDEKKIYPAILDIHGGPKTVYGEVFYHEMQYFASEGYFVFFCNPRGSDGKGNEFSDIRGKYGSIDYDDLMKFTDEVLNKYENIDKDRVGVTGGSYGGFMTNWIIGHTDRFKAAASQRSISNWISKFGTTDIGYYFVDDQQSGTPWNNADKLWWHSPLKYADKVKTPTLFIHSDEDYRCWMAEALQMFSALKYHGVDSRMCLFKGENHELSRSGKPAHRMRRLKEIINWFDHYLK